MKKRILSTLLALCMVLALLPGTALAADSGSCGRDATWKLTGNTLTISGSGQMYNYYYKETPWYSQRADIETVNINGVDYIGNRAFQDFVNLTQVDIGSSVTQIGYSAFQGCVSLSNLTIPGNVSQLDENAFAQCSSLRNLTLRSGVNTIGKGAFYQCSSLTNVTLPVGVTSIGESAFQECISLKTISIPVGVTSIGRCAFYNCTSLTGVSFPLTVTYIGNYAFQNCSSMTGLTIPSNVLTIGEGAFMSCTGLKRLTIHDGVKSIGFRAFAQCSKLTSVVIPEADLSNCIFEKCTGLTSAVLKDGSTVIPDWTFNVCQKLKSVTIPSSVTIIGHAAFSNCTALEDVYYAGTEAQWGKINISDYNANNYNKPLFLATKHYNSSGNGDDEVFLAAPTLKLSATSVPEGTAVTVSWNAVFGADKYHYELEDDAGDGFKMLIGETDGKSCKMLSTLVPGRYRVTVYATNGAEKGPSSSAVFTVTKKATTKTYTIKLNANSGKVSPSSIKVESGKTYLNELPTPTRSGYKFNGWYTTRTGGTKITSTTKATANRTIYAQWTSLKKTFLVTFDPNGGMVHLDRKVVPTGVLYRDLPTPTKNNSHFQGWYTKKTGGTKVTASSRVNLTADQTLYARWQNSASVRSTQRGTYRVTIPAYYELALYTSSNSAKIANTVETTGYQTVTCTQRVTLSNGAVRYYGKVNNRNCWFTYSCEMDVN